MFLAEKKKIALKKLLQKQYVFNIGHTEKKNTEECKNNPLPYYLKIANYY